MYKLCGANLDFDLTTSQSEISRWPDACPCNKDAGERLPRRAVKNTSIGPNFYGVESLDQVLYCFPRDQSNGKQAQP